MRIAFIIILVTLSIGVLAQNNKPNYIRYKNTIGINLFGDVSLISINYERHLLVSPNAFVSGKLGMGLNMEFPLCYNFVGGCDEPDGFGTFTHHLTSSIGGDKNFLEFGLGGTLIRIFGSSQFVHSNFKYHEYFLFPILGYRFQPLSTRSTSVTFRAYTYLPFSLSNPRDLSSVFDWGYLLIMPFGVSIGLNFNWKDL